MDRAGVQAPVPRCTVMQTNSANGRLARRYRPAELVDSLCGEGGRGQQWKLMVVARLSVLVCLALVACANEPARMAGPGDASGEAGAAGGSGGGGSRDGGAGVLAG